MVYLGNYGAGIGEEWRGDGEVPVIGYILRLWCGEAFVLMVIEALRHKHKEARMLVQEATPVEPGRQGHILEPGAWIGPGSVRDD